MDFLPKDPAILEIRKAERHDVPLLLEFIKGIARYAKMEDEVIASPDVLEREMFDEHRAKIEAKATERPCYCIWPR